MRKANKQYLLQEESIENFINVSREIMSAKDWDKYYTSMKDSAGESFHIFEFLISGLVLTKTPIKPTLRKAIDEVLTNYMIDRENWPELRELNYDEYWKDVYGYKSSKPTNP